MYLPVHDQSMKYTISGSNISPKIGLPVFMKAETVVLFNYSIYTVSYSKLKHIDS